jgi:hypothetical protein
MHNFSMTRLAFDNSVVDTTRGVAVRTHDFTVFELNGSVKPGVALGVPPPFEPGSKLIQLTNKAQFSNVAGLTVDDSGRLFFTDAAMHSIFRWDSEHSRAELLSNAVDSPVTEAYVGDGRLLVLDSGKLVYTVSTTDGSSQKVVGQDAHSGTIFMLPTGFHNDIGSVQRIVEHKGLIYAPRSNMAIVGALENEPRTFFYSPGSNTAIMAGGSWKGLLQAIQLSPFRVGQSRYGVSEEDDKVYRLALASPTQLTAEPFIARSGTSIVTDSNGNIYVAGAQLFVYSSTGKSIGTLEIPERPGSLAFGGTDHRTLFIGARSSLYSIRTRVAGVD